MVWDVKELIEWVLKNEWNFYNDEFPKEYILGGDSIAEYRCKYYESRSDDNIDDEADAILDDYRMHHCIHYGMSGTETVDAYIGKRGARYEISYYYDENHNWEYTINLPDFINDVRSLKEKMRL
jgi:hypothetical protein